LAATKDYQAEQDLLGAFLAERRLQGPNYQAKANVLYGAYKDWCEQSGERLVSKRNLCVALREKGFDEYKNDALWFRGVAVADQRDETRDEGRFSG
jgi:phage/plasmid-associated DNA primase